MKLRFFGFITESDPGSSCAKEIRTNFKLRKVSTKVLPKSNPKEPSSTAKPSFEEEKRKDPPKPYAREVLSNTEPKVAIQNTKSNEVLANPDPKETHSNPEPKEDLHKRNIRKIVKKLTRSGQPTCTICFKGTVKTFLRCNGWDYLQSETVLIVKFIEKKVNLP